MLETLLDEVEGNALLNGQLSSRVTNKTKEMEWRRITTKLNALSLTVLHWQRVRAKKNDWFSRVKNKVCTYLGYILLFLVYQ